MGRGCGASFLGQHPGGGDPAQQLTVGRCFPPPWILNRQEGFDGGEGGALSSPGIGRSEARKDQNAPEIGTNT